MTHELLDALRELVARCDGDEGVRADGSNIQTIRAHEAIARAECGGDAVETTAASIATATTEEFRKARASCGLLARGVALTIYTPIAELPVRRVVELALSPAAADELARSLASYAAIAREHMPNATRYATEDEVRALGHSDDYVRGYMDRATGHDADPPGLRARSQQRRDYQNGYDAASEVRL